MITSRPEASTTGAAPLHNPRAVQTAFAQIWMSVARPGFSACRANMDGRCMACNCGFPLVANKIIYWYNRSLSAYLFNKIRARALPGEEIA